jgi:hypothetical protein
MTMDKSLIIRTILIAAIAVLVAVGVISSLETDSDYAVYATAEECVEESRGTCQFQECDTFCPRDFEPGWVSANAPPELLKPVTVPVVYTSQEECESNTGDQCGYTMKDLDCTEQYPCFEGWIGTGYNLGDSPDERNLIHIEAGREFDANGVHHISGSIDLPTPCHSLEIESRIAESFPEQVFIDFIIKRGDPDIDCIQVVTPTSFDLEFSVDERATFRAMLNGERVILEFIEVE